jgi:hypothetical protein
MYKKRSYYYNEIKLYKSIEYQILSILNEKKAALALIQNKIITTEL